MNPYETRHQHLSAAKKLFHIYWMVQVPNYVSQTSNPINALLGIPTTGDRDMDREMAMSMATKEHTIAEIAELIHDGAPVNFVKPGDGSVVYHYIQDYLKQLLERRTQLVGFQDSVPIEDLEKLDLMASTLYPLVRDNFHREDKTGGFRSLLRNMGRPMSRHGSVTTQSRESHEQHQSVFDDLQEFDIPKGNPFNNH